MRHIIRRISIYVLAIWAAITLNFFLPRLAPGNPAEVIFSRLQGQGANPALLNALEVEFGIHTTDSLWVQYLKYLNNLIHGDLGISFQYYPSPVSEVIGQSIQWTLALLTVSVVISFTLGTLLGMYMAWKRGSTLDTVLSSLMMFFYSILYPWLALLTVYFLGYTLGWFPFSDGYDVGYVTPGFNLDFISSAAIHAILPALTIVVSTIAGWMLTMRNSMITTLSEDYVLMAKAKGLSSRRVMFAYAARNAILPSVTGFAIALGTVVGGQLLVEIIFNYPGIGLALYQGITAHDYALADGVLLLVVLATVFMNLIVDLLYTVLDPRVRQEGNA